MSKKAVLIFDVPESCSDCCCYNSKWGECGVTEDEVVTLTAYGTRPKWCPLIITTTGDIQKMQRIHDRLELEKENRL